MSNRGTAVRELIGPSIVLFVMGDSQTLSDAKTSARSEATLARPLAPEDVRAGDYVAILHITLEVPSFLWCAETFQMPAHEPVRMQLIPDEGGLPLKVQAVCLPFVFVKGPVGEQKTLDLRKCRLARLNRAYAKVVWKACKKKQSKSTLSWLL